MPQSSDIKDLAGALSKAQAALTAAKKDAINPHFKNRYATLQSVWDAAKEVLAPNGLSVVQTFEPTGGSRMDITTTLIHSSGQWIGGTLSLLPQRADPQGIGSAITYGRRYALAAILGIVSDDDDDGEAASRPVTTGHVAPPVQTPRHSLVAPVSKTMSPPVGHSWREAIIPPFIKKWKGKRLGEMDEKDLLWWARNYKPEPYKGEIQKKDVDFRFALTEAKAFLDSRDIELLPATGPSDKAMANQADEPVRPDQDVPF